jgi:hypothetical protein
VPGRDATLVRELFEELGVLQNGSWEERYLCFSPQERLFLHGRWQEGLEPEIAATARDREQYRRFAQRMGEFRASGEFTIPLERGMRSWDLDRISMAEWLRANRFDSPYLTWYVNYACRDDYGAAAGATSAWAGIHYFAAREHEEKGPLTWPEGNGWIVRRLLERIGAFVRTGAMALRVTSSFRGALVRTRDVEYDTQAVIFAAPTFLARHIVEASPPVAGFEYSPWLTANLTLDRPPRERGIEPAWDNVIYDSPALGYVVATHQGLGSYPDRTVWTYYWALANGPARENRQLLLDRDWAYWKEAILNDLARAHPDIHSCVRRVDIMRMGHAMVRPVPGTIFHPDRRRLAHSKGPILFANSDLSGISIFEEAWYRGTRAADAALRRISGA